MIPHDISEIASDDDVEVVRVMLRRYVQWLFDAFPEETEDLHSYYSSERLQQALDDVATKFVPPIGIALIARIEGRPVGCVFALPIEPGIAEVKRLFVLPSERGRGLGRALLEAIIARMGAWGHPTIRLDTAVFLNDAIALYRRMGFVEIEPYTSLPPDTDKTAVFMELRR
jgi:GNAT superfamily N-acetyltransferase